MYYQRITTTLITLLLLTVSPLIGQSTSYSLQEGYNLKVEGTSNVRDWDAVAESIDATFQLQHEGSVNLSEFSPGQFERLELRIPVEDLQSDGRRLTNAVHEYLEKDNHPVITFELVEIKQLQNRSDGERATLTAEGVINAAGQDFTTEMSVDVHRTSDGGLRFVGSQDLKMTDFGISPPRAMMGTIRSDDELTVEFDVTFKP